MTAAMRTAAIVCAIAASLSAHGAAQRPPVQADWCMHPKPLAECRRFLFFDDGAAFGVLRAPHDLTPPPFNGIPFGARRFEDLPHYGMGMIGMMSNVDSSSAIGASFEFGYTAEHPRISIKGHRRGWNPGGGSLDVSGGPLAVEVPEFERGTGCPSCLTRVWAYGATTDIALVERHGLGVMAGADLIHGSGRTSAGVHAGVRFESYPAVVAVLTVGALGALWTYALFHSQE